MRISINATFDSDTEQTIYKLKQQIVEANPSIPAQSIYRPHITLAAYEVQDTQFYEHQLTALANQFQQFPVQLDVIGIFPENGVVFLCRECLKHSFGYKESPVNR